MSGFQIERHALLEGVPHGFFGSNGGGDQFGFGGPGDGAEVRKLRAAAAAAILPAGRLAAPHQVHSPDVVTATAAWDDAAEGRPVADAVVTATPGIVLESGELVPGYLPPPRLLAYILGARDTEAQSE